MSEAPAPRAAPVEWRPVDCHAHSTHSDGALTVPQVVAVARERGVVPAVSDHLSRDVTGGVASPAAVAAYLDDLERHDVLRSGEFCWHDSLWRELPPALVARFTHRVGSLHAIFLPGGATLHAFRREYPASLPPDVYMEHHVENLERFAREMPVDVLAHPTLLPLALRHRPLEELWTEAREARAVAALRRAGIAFEISNRYRPHERFVGRALAAGVRLSLGSDGHTYDQVADLAWPLALARSLGAKDEELYDPRVHGSRTGYWERSAA